MPIAEQGLATRELWDLNAKAAATCDIDLAVTTGEELMRRTDRSSKRCAQANREQAERRDALRRSGAADREFPV